LNEPLLGGLLEPIEIGIRGQSLWHGNLLSLRPATAILGQERRRCQRTAGGGFNPLRGPSVACSTNRKIISGKSAKSSATKIQSQAFCSLGRPNSGRRQSDRPAISRGLSSTGRSAKSQLGAKLTIGAHGRWPAIVGPQLPWKSGTALELRRSGCTFFDFSGYGQF
jgi:hypothetical protein